jgi:DNA adenine methylase (dam)
MIDISKVEPILKWAGGKRQLLSEIERLLPEDFYNRKYYEPFFGGGAVFFYFNPQKAVINDTNIELINLYSTVKDNPEKLISCLKRMKNEKDEFYYIRGLDRREEYAKMTSIERAARIVYLNRTSFNGLYRVNSKGQYNTPFGNYKTPKIVDEERIMNMHNFFRKSKTQMLSTDFEKALEGIQSESFVYFDPPYDPLSKTANFTSYSENDFTQRDQIRLRDLCVKLHKKKIKFMVSNSDTKFINELYGDEQIFKIHKVIVRRMIGAKKETRKPVFEVLITNY